MLKNKLKRAKNELVGEVLVTWTNFCKKWHLFRVVSTTEPWNINDEEAFTYGEVILHTLSMFFTITSLFIVYGSILFPSFATGFGDFLETLPQPILIISIILFTFALVMGAVYPLMLFLSIMEYLNPIWEVIVKCLVVVFVSIWKVIDYLLTPLFYWGVYSKRMHKARTKGRRKK